MVCSLVAFVSAGARDISRSKPCAKCWHAHPFIKSSHVGRFCIQVLPDISARRIRDVGHGREKRQQIAEMQSSEIQKALSAQSLPFHLV